MSGGRSSLQLEHRPSETKRKLQEQGKLGQQQQQQRQEGDAGGAGDGEAGGSMFRHPLTPIRSTYVEVTGAWQAAGRCGGHSGTRARGQGVAGWRARAGACMAALGTAAPRSLPCRLPHCLPWSY